MRSSCCGGRNLSVTRFYLIVGLVILADQFTKWTVVRAVPFGASRPVVGPLLSLTHTRNTGGAFSLFQANNSAFIIVAAIAILALLIAYHRYHRDNLQVSTALSLALGGAIGNLIDRVRFGYVVDFFDIHVWPIFNIADSAITVAIVLLMWKFIVTREPAALPRLAAPVSDAADKPEA